MRVKSALAVLASSAMGVFAAQPTANLHLLTTESDAIVVGTVSKVSTGHVKQVTIGDGVPARIVHTLATVDVSERLKGADDSPSVTVELAGGRRGRFVTFVPDEATLSPGQEVLLFLRPAAPGARHYVVSFGKQGSFRLLADGKALQEDARGVLLPGYEKGAAIPVQALRRSVTAIDQR